MAGKGGGSSYDNLGVPVSDFQVIISLHIFQRGVAGLFGDLSVRGAKATAVLRDPVVELESHWSKTYLGRDFGEFLNGERL